MGPTASTRSLLCDIQLELPVVLSRIDHMTSRADTSAIEQASNELPATLSPTSQRRQSPLNPHFIMNSFKIARAALRVRPTAIQTTLGRRGYAEAVSDKVGSAHQILRPWLTSRRSS